MSGHSKWSSIKHKKAAVDAKRGKLFTKLIREITVSARIGGGAPETNPRLRAALMAAKSANMPHDNVRRAIQKGTGELPGIQYDEVVFEGYGPEGVAIYVEAMTDNKNRTLPEMRFLFTKFGGGLGANNCVAWMFDKKGVIVVEKKTISEEELFGLAADAGAEDIRDDGENFEILTPPDKYLQVVEALGKKEIPLIANELAMIPKTTISLSGSHAKKVIGMMDALENHDDVQHVWANCHIDSSEIRE